MLRFDVWNFGVEHWQGVWGVNVGIHDIIATYELEIGFRAS